VPLAPGYGTAITLGGPNAVYRLYNFNTLVHLYTTDWTEAETANNNYGFSFEQVMARAVDCVHTACPGPYAAAVYRASNNVNNEFLYTTSLQEASTTNGYTYNGIAFYVYKNIGGLCPLYRLYDWWAGRHYYTVSPHEWNASQNSGYVTQEGILGYLSPLNSPTCPN